MPCPTCAGTGAVPESVLLTCGARYLVQDDNWTECHLEAMHTGSHRADNRWGGRFRWGPVEGTGAVAVGESTLTHEVVLIRALKCILRITRDEEAKYVASKALGEVTTTRVWKFNQRVRWPIHKRVWTARRRIARWLLGGSGAYMLGVIIDVDEVGKVSIRPQETGEPFVRCHTDAPSEPGILVTNLTFLP